MAPALFRHRLTPFIGLVLVLFSPTSVLAIETNWTVSTSGTAEGTSETGALDGNRMSTDSKSLWKGTKAQKAFWQVTFPESREIGAILQINGDHPLALQNAARNYYWQGSLDGTSWKVLRETVTHHEKRLYRIHRLAEPVKVRHLRLVVNLTTGDAPTLREVEFFSEVDAKIPFDDWIVAISSHEDPDQPLVGKPFVQLARTCDGMENLPAQCLWHGDFDESFVSAEPRPLCAFLSGSYLEWCQCAREPWRGVEKVLKSRRLPMWGACGGGQILAILEVTGVDRPWDCPRCRDPNSPLLPVYSHIGHLGDSPCGEYDQNIWERGIYQMQITANDPVLEGVPEVFEIMESHIGQMDFVPPGWTRIITKGPGAHTINQGLRVNTAPIYAVQFHMETFAKTHDVSRTIMSNFLREAKAWGGYHPNATPLAPPTPLSNPSTP